MTCEPGRISEGLPTIELCDVRLAAIDERQCIDHILEESDAGRGGWVITPNLDHLYRCRRDPEFRAFLRMADLAVADGMPLVWASRVMGQPLPGRVAGSDLLSTLSEAAATRGKSIFLLGGNPGTAESAAAELRRRHPALEVCGTHCPPLGFERDDAELMKIAERLRFAKPDIVFVALGSPKQERLVASMLLRWRHVLPRVWWLGVGISFSFLAGEVHRAPRWLQRIGLEWLHRLASEPRRLARRYLLQNLPFAMRLFGSAIGTRLKAGPGGILLTGDAKP